MMRIRAKTMTARGQKRRFQPQAVTSGLPQLRTSPCIEQTVAKGPLRTHASQQFGLGSLQLVHSSIGNSANTNQPGPATRA